jgi:hypothetical protein
MSGKLLRALMAVATFTVVWLLVSPASAATSAAPICDIRGAITFAPPPQIQDEERSIDIPADCQTESPLDNPNFTPGRSAPPDISFSQEPAAGMATGLPELSFSERVAAPVAERAPPRPGVSSSLDRPPRS